jgi:hypothetical protein
MANLSRPESWIPLTALGLGLATVADPVSAWDLRCQIRESSSRASSSSIPGRCQGSAPRSRVQASLLTYA